MKKITQITTTAYHQILETVGSTRAEAGGVLFGSIDDSVVQHFVYDKDAVTTTGTYTLNAPYLNKKIDEMRAKGLDLVGFLHSHPQGYKALSSQDIQYFKSQFNNFSDLEYFITPLVFSAVDGTYDFIPYIINKEGEVTKTELELVPDDYRGFIEHPPELLPPIPIEADHEQNNNSAFTFKHYYLFLWSTFLTGSLVFLLCSLWLAFQYMNNQFKLSTLWTIVE